MARFRPESSAAAPRRAALLLALVAAGSASAQESREQAAHVHGTTQVALALVAGELQLELTAPGMDLVGFEHAPRDDQQALAISQAIATLERSGDWLGFDPDGSCTVTDVDAHSHGFEAGGADGEAEPGGDGDHDQHHGHGDDHDHEHAAGGHGEFHLKLTGTCTATPQALRIDLAARFAGIEQVRVDLITDRHQDRIELSAGQTRVPLAR